MAARKSGLNVHDGWLMARQLEAIAIWLLGIASFLGCCFAVMFFGQAFLG
jgi:hypothetical protein